MRAVRPPAAGESELIYWHWRPEEFVVSEMPLDNMAKATRVMKAPVRQYFHADTRQPLTVGEWVAEHNPDANIDETWQAQVNDAVRRLV